MPRARCKHCGKRPAKLVSKGIGSCCYQIPGVRDLYPRLPRKKRKGKKHQFRPDLTRGEIVGMVQGRVPAEPTDAMPGSRAKAKVMAERLERGEMPHHPLDRRDKLMEPGWDARLSVQFEEASPTAGNP